MMRAADADRSQDRAHGSVLDAARCARGAFTPPHYRCSRASAGDFGQTRSTDAAAASRSAALMVRGATAPARSESAMMRGRLAQASRR